MDFSLTGIATGVLVWLVVLIIIIAIVLGATWMVRKIFRL